MNTKDDDRDVTWVSVPYFDANNYVILQSLQALFK